MPYITLYFITSHNGPLICYHVDDIVDAFYIECGEYISN